MDPALVLAIACVAEIDLGAGLDECRTMWSMNAEQAAARGVSVAEQSADYNSILRKRKDGRWLVSTPRARWVRGLDRAGDEPGGWPSNVSWERSRPQWIAVLAAADAFLAAPPPNPCPEADHYGGSCENPRGACDPPRECWVRVDCGQTRQAYWRVDPGCSRAGTVPAGVAAGRREHLEGG